MASTFKRKYNKVVNGKKVKMQSKCWYVKYRDGDGIEHRVKGYPDKEATRQMAARLEKEAALANEGVVDRYKEHRRRPLLEHLEDFRQSLLARGDTVEHARLTKYRIESILTGCGFVFSPDIQASRLQRYLAGLRADGEGIGAQTYNYYLQSAKQFCRWMVQDGRAAESPIEHLKSINARVDRRRERRALEPDELKRLLETVVKGPERYGMSGYERYLLYRFAAETGLRANEIRTLTVQSFDFDQLGVTVQAGHSKRRRQDHQPLRPDTAQLLKEFFAGKMPAAKAFGGTYKRLTKRTANIVKADLADAGIPYLDAAGRYADFHSLRHTMGSLLAASGVHPKVAQSLMRHSDINLTMSRYTHTLTGQEAEAIRNLPDLSLSRIESQRVVATGTCDATPDATQSAGRKLTPELTPNLTPTAFPARNRLSAIGTGGGEKPPESANDKPLQDRDLDSDCHRLAGADRGEKEMGRGGFEPPTHGFSVRCSTN